MTENKLEHHELFCRLTRKGLSFIFCPQEMICHRLTLAEAVLLTLCFEETSIVSLPWRLDSEVGSEKLWNLMTKSNCRVAMSDRGRKSCSIFYFRCSLFTQCLV